MSNIIICTGNDGLHTVLQVRDETKTESDGFNPVVLGAEDDEIVPNSVV
jgi:hypothetical protein